MVSNRTNEMINRDTLVGGQLFSKEVQLLLHLFQHRLFLAQRPLLGIQLSIQLLSLTGQLRDGHASRTAWRRCASCRMSRVPRTSGAVPSGARVR